MTNIVAKSWNSYDDILDYSKIFNRLIFLKDHKNIVSNYRNYLIYISDP